MFYANGRDTYVFQEPNFEFINLQLTPEDRAIVNFQMGCIYYGGLLKEINLNSMSTMLKSRCRRLDWNQDKMRPIRTLIRKTGQI